MESRDGGEARLSKILHLIGESKYSVHDISRLRAKQVDEFYRLDMPFEPGLDMGCRSFKPGRYAGKKCLILESEHDRYHAVLLDLSGSDIEAHDDDPEKALIAVRNGLNHEAVLDAPGSAKIGGTFTDFMTDNYRELKSKGFSEKDIKSLPIDELMRYMSRWVKDNVVI